MQSMVHRLLALTSLSNKELQIRQSSRQRSCSKVLRGYELGKTESMVLEAVQVEL